MPNETRNPNAQEAQRPQTRGFGSRSISICPNRRRPRESLVLVVVLVLVIGNGAVEGEEEKEDDDDWVAAPLRRAVSQSGTLPEVGKLRGVGPIRRSAEYNSANTLNRCRRG